MVSSVCSNSRKRAGNPTEWRKHPLQHAFPLPLLILVLAPGRASSAPAPAPSPGLSPPGNFSVSFNFNFTTPTLSPPPPVISADHSPASPTSAAAAPFTLAPRAPGPSAAAPAPAVAAEGASPGLRAPIPFCPGHPPAYPIPAIFAFGDANANTGNDNYRNDTPLHADFPPNGRTFFGRPTGRVSDGRLVVDFLCEYLGIPFLTPSLRPGGDLRQGASFATGGSSATNSTLEPGWGFPLSKQIDLFLSLHANVTALGRTPPAAPSSLPFPFSMFPWGSGAPGANPDVARLPTLRTLREALYYIQIGEVNFLQLIYQSQDFGTNAAAWASFVAPRVATDVINSIQDALRQLYAAGARRFLLFTVFPQACTPLVRARAGLSPGNTSCVEYATPMVDLYNDSLESLLASLRTSLIGSTIILSRADQILDRILADPGAYRMSSNISACCEGGSFSAYSSDIGGCGMPGYTLCPPSDVRIFWDLLHTTEAVSRVVARETWQGHQFVEPFNLSTLACGYTP